jgi:predicted transcriptional regulator
MAHTTRTRFNFYLDDDLRKALTALKERDGVPESESIRRAIAAWVEAKGITKKADRRRAVRR